MEFNTNESSFKQERKLFYELNYLFTKNVEAINKLLQEIIKEQNPEGKVRHMNASIYIIIKKVSRQIRIIFGTLCVYLRCSALFRFILQYCSFIQWCSNIIQKYHTYNINSMLIPVESYNFFPKIFFFCLNNALVWITYNGFVCIQYPS